MVLTGQFKVQVHSPFKSSSGRFYEHLPDSVHCSNGCLDLRLDWFSRAEWVDSYTSCLCRGIADFAFHSRQTRGSRPAHHEMNAQRFLVSHVEGAALHQA